VKKIKDQIAKNQFFALRLIVHGAANLKSGRKKIKMKIKKIKMKNRSDK